VESPKERRALLRADLAGFAHRAFGELNPRAQLATNWHYEAIAAKLAAVYHVRLGRLIINQPPGGPNPLKSLRLGGHGWKIGWKILFTHRSGHPLSFDERPATGRQLVSSSMFSDCIALWW